MTPQIVGVIFSRADLQRALRMRKPPDFFELRLDGLISCLDEARRAVPQIRAPLIVTARHPGEGGVNNLSAARRRALLLEFLPSARYIDVELRSTAAFRRVLEAAAQNRIETIISFHDFQRPPGPAQLERIAARAHSLGAALLKIAVRTDTPAQLDILLDFFDRHRRAPNTVAMGIGRLGRASRLTLVRRGCLLNYGYLGSPAAGGQLSLEELRRFAARANSVS
jgi:3-dehydroquinate dehydratase-1